MAGLPAREPDEEDETAQLPTFVTQADALMDLLSSVLAVCRPLNDERAADVPAYAGVEPLACDAVSRQCAGH